MAQSDQVILFVISECIDEGAQDDPKFSNTDSEGDTSLHLAAFNNQVKVMRKLIAVYQNLDIKNTCGVTSLGHASYKGHLEIVKELVESGADVNTVDIMGDTPLHNASVGGYTEIVEYLLKHKADKTITNEEGQTAADVAINEEIKELFNIY